MSIICNSHAYQPSTKDISDEIVLSLYKIKENCAKHKPYNTGSNEIALIEIKKMCMRAAELPIDSVAKKTCVIMHHTYSEIDEMKTACSRQFIGKEYSEKKLQPYFLGFYKTHHCENIEICYEDFLNEFSSKNINKYKSCTHDNKFYYENFCKFFNRKK